jgi:hypothetical protein
MIPIEKPIRIDRDPVLISESGRGWKYSADPVRIRLVDLHNILPK